jgi:Holliday junction resolvasome RuvABC endonuclease subunit
MGDQRQQQTKFKILAFDPSLTNTGWSLLEGNVNDGDLTVLKIGEIRPGPTADKAIYREEVEKYGKRTISLDVLRKEITKLLLELRPDFVAAEDIYINMHRPMAYGALAMWVIICKVTCRDVAGLPVTLIPTKICKQATSGYGGNGKASIQAAIVSHKHITFKNKDDKFEMSEHQADSIAVGVAFSDRFKQVILNTLGYVT